MKNLYSLLLDLISHLCASAGIMLVDLSNCTRLSYNRAQSFPDFTSVAYSGSILLGSPLKHIIKSVEVVLPHENREITIVSSKRLK